MIKKKVIKIGTSLGITFDKILIESYNIQKGDFIDVSDLVVIKNKERKKKK